MGEESYRHPYTPSPGSSTPEPSVGPEEGMHEMRAFFWLALVNTAIIAGSMIGVWWFVH